MQLVTVMQPYLRLAEQEDAEQIITWVNDPLVTGRSEKYPVSLTELKERLSTWSEGRNDWVCVIIEDNSIVGLCGLHKIDWTRQNARLSILIRKEKQGQGIGTIAINELLRIGFEDLGLHKIYLEALLINPAISLYQRIGFTHEGLLREEYHHHGKHQDMIRMAILRKEWKTTEVGR
ncbi:MAG: GNAT family protein [Nanoarchaeota archaeon]